MNREDVLNHVQDVFRDIFDDDTMIVENKTNPFLFDIVLDKMYKSGVGKFDQFSNFRRIEVTVRDGDEIVKIEEYADRILQFKKDKMHLVNVSQDVEFLEDTFMYKGVRHPASVCKTDYGIAWANRRGVYLYDGQKVINLLEKGGKQIIKESEWKNFLAADKSYGGNETELTPMVGYIPHKRQIIIYDDITLQIKKGKTTAIMGPSGIGKTTMLRLMGGQLVPDKGDVKFKGESIAAHVTFVKGERSALAELAANIL